MGFQQVTAISPLSERPLLRYLTFGALYVAQGIPEGFLIFAMPAWLAMNGRTPGEIGAFLGISLLPWSFKLINAPVMDRFTFLPMGRRRPWVMVGQLGLVTVFLLHALIDDPATNLTVLTALGFMVSFFSSFQDVAVDGMAIDIVPLDQQARANGIMWGAKTVGISSSVALGSVLLNTWGFAPTVCVFSAAIGAIMLFPLLLRERPGERLLPWTEGETSPAAAANQLHDWGTIFGSLVKVFFLPMSLLMGIAVFSSSIGKGLFDAVLPVMTVQELGWADTGYSRIFAAANLVSGLLGMLIGGVLVDFFGRVRMMTVFLGSLAVVVGSMALLSPFWSQDGVVAAFIVGFYVIHVMYTIAVFATAMQLCWKRVAATQFTLYMAVSNLGLSAGAALMGALSERFAYPVVIAAYLAFAGFSLCLLRFVRLERHQPRLERLEPESGQILAAVEASAVVVPLVDGDDEDAELAV
jgi:PAT family beta-lactamase induction signal transducer AmpG